jgi:hypothetical protein
VEAEVRVQALAGPHLVRGRRRRVRRLGWTPLSRQKIIEIKPEVEVTTRLFLVSVKSFERRNSLNRLLPFLFSKVLIFEVSAIVGA